MISDGGLGRPARCHCFQTIRPGLLSMGGRGGTVGILSGMTITADDVQECADLSKSAHSAGEPWPVDLAPPDGKSRTEARFLLAAEIHRATASLIPPKTDHPLGIPAWVATGKLGYGVIAGLPQFDPKRGQVRFHCPFDHVGMFDGRPVFLDTQLPERAVLVGLGNRYQILLISHQPWVQAQPTLPSAA